MSQVSQPFIEALRDGTIVAPQGPDAAAFETLQRLQKLEVRVVGVDK